MSRHPTDIERELLFALPFAAGCVALVLWLVACDVRHDHRPCLGVVRRVARSPRGAVGAGMMTRKPSGPSLHA